MTRNTSWQYTVEEIDSKRHGIKYALGVSESHDVSDGFRWQLRHHCSYRVCAFSGCFADSESTDTETRKSNVGCCRC